MEELPQWIGSLIQSLLYFGATIIGLRMMVTGKLVGIEGKLDNHIVSNDNDFEIIKTELEFNSQKTDENSDFAEGLANNNLFYRELLEIGAYACKDITKYNGGKIDEDANLYINAFVDSMKALSVDILMVGIESTSRDFITSKASCIIQNLSKIYIAFWGEEIGMEYLERGKPDRQEYINRLFELIEDRANNKNTRFKAMTLDFCHEIISNFTRFYYSNNIGGKNV